MSMGHLGLSLLGGVLIGVASAALMLFNGRIAGITGIVAGTLMPKEGDTLWRALFVGGLLTGGVVLMLVHPTVFSLPPHRSLAALAVAGLLVGYGTRLGNGCTSGHGVCGLGRLSKRSLAATLTFIGAGALMVFVVEHLFGGAL